MSDAAHTCNGSPKREIILACAACTSRKASRGELKYRRMPSICQAEMKPYNDDVALPVDASLS